jgi:hypothetical protein
MSGGKGEAKYLPLTPDFLKRPKLKQIKNIPNINK